ncbi:MAG TPA: hypothetical protein VF683_02735 [Chthoniobacterales bacterium]|jgi:type II secretory pathway pseudopilin PulG
MRCAKQNEAGTTLPELMITALVVGIFFSAIFEVSAVCFRYVSASKENIAALECVHDRIEQLRNTDFPSLIDPTYLAVTPAVPAPSPMPSPPQRRNLTTPANGSELARYATEEVTISTFNGTTATTPKVKFSRPAGAKFNHTPFSDTNITPTIEWTGGTTLANATAVQVDVTYRWTSTLGRRPRSESSCIIVSAGTKK